MSEISVVSLKDKLNGWLELTLETNTSVGKLKIPVSMEDRGSLALNEEKAYQDALILVEETAAELRRLLQRGHLR